MATVILVRHGRTTANTAGILAGRAGGVRLDAVGRAQAERTAESLAAVPLSALVTSPLERCRQTARIILDRQDGRTAAQVDAGLTECHYGRWQGRSLADLVREPLWSTVQQQPSAAVFPDGESLAAMQARAVAAVRRHDADVEARAGAAAVWAAVSHGDVIKSVLADALGLHLDLFQRLTVHPAAISVVRYGPTRPEVVTVNAAPGGLGWLAATRPAADAPVGGGAGPVPVADGS